MSVRRRSCARSSQQTRDDASNAARMEHFGESNFRLMKHNLTLYLGRHFNLKVVSLLANETASKLGYEIDRCSRRKFNILILWIFERWEEIGDLFLQNMNNYLQHADDLESEERCADLSCIEMIKPDVNQETSTNIENNQELGVNYDTDQEVDPFNLFESDYNEFSFTLDQDF